MTNVAMVGSEGRVRRLQASGRLRLELLDERRFGQGVVHLRYRVAGA